MLALGTHQPSSAQQTGRQRCGCGPSSTHWPQLGQPARMRGLRGVCLRSRAAALWYCHTHHSHTHNTVGAYTPSDTNAISSHAYQGAAQTYHQMHHPDGGLYDSQRDPCRDAIPSIHGKSDALPAAARVPVVAATATAAAEPPPPAAGGSATRTAGTVAVSQQQQLEPVMSAASSDVGGEATPTTASTAPAAGSSSGTAAITVATAAAVVTQHCMEAAAVATAAAAASGRLADTYLPVTCAQVLVRSEPRPIYLPGVTGSYHRRVMNGYLPSVTIHPLAAVVRTHARVRAPVRSGGGGVGAGL